MLKIKLANQCCTNEKARNKYAYANVVSYLEIRFSAKIYLQNAKLPAFGFVVVTSQYTFTKQEI